MPFDSLVTFLVHIPEHPGLVLSDWPIDALWPIGNILSSHSWASRVGSQWLTYMPFDPLVTFLVHIPGYPGWVLSDWPIDALWPIVTFLVHIPGHPGLVLSDWPTDALWPIGNLHSSHSCASRFGSQWLTYTCPLTHCNHLSSHSWASRVGSQWLTYRCPLPHW